MPKIICLCMTLTLTFFIFATAMALDLRPHINDIISYTQNQQLCGEFVSDGGAYDKFVFGDGNQVVIHVSALEFATTYFIKETIIFMQTEKYLIELEIESPTLLKGKDSWTKDQSYTRKSIPKKSCTPYSPKQTERIDLKNQLCFLSGVELQNKNDLKGAADRFLECCDSGDARSCNKYGFLRYFIGSDRETAFKYFRKACDLGYGGGCANLADFEQKKGNIQKAKQLYEEACSKQFQAACFKSALLESSVQDGESYSKQGDFYSKKGQYDKAISEYSKAIEINPKYADAYFNRGYAYQNKGQYDQAISDYNKAIELNPRDADAYSNRGAAYGGKGQFDQAISDHNKAIELNPRDANAYSNRGLAYVGKGQFDQAISDYNKAIELSPTHTNAYYNIGCVYSLQNNLSEALKYLELVLENGYDNFDWISKDPDWDNIRSSNEFKMLIDKYNK